MRKPKDEQREIDRSQGALLGLVKPSQFLRHFNPLLGYALRVWGIEHQMHSR